MELDPKFVDVSFRRWQEYSNMDARARIGRQNLQGTGSGKCRGAIKNTGWKW